MMSSIENLYQKLLFYLTAQKRGDVMKSDFVIGFALGAGKLALPSEVMEAKSLGASLCITRFAQL